jgi:hypothetical protein
MQCRVALRMGILHRLTSSKLEPQAYPMRLATTPVMQAGMLTAVQAGRALPRSAPHLQTRQDTQAVPSNHQALTPRGQHHQCRLAQTL